MFQLLNDCTHLTHYQSNTQIFQVRLQQYTNRELPDDQAGFRKGWGTRDQIVNVCWIIKKTREFQKNIYFCFIDYAKLLTVWITTNCGKFFKRWEYQITLPASYKYACRLRNNSENQTWNNGLVPNWERSTSRLYIVLMKVKEESKKASLKLNIQKTKIMASGLINSWQIDGEAMKTMTEFILGAKTSLQMVTVAMKLKDAYSLKGKLWPA